MPDRSDSSRPSGSPSFLGTIALVLLAIAALFAIDTFLEKAQMSETTDEASRRFQEGQILEQQRRYAEAIERFRGALSIARTNREYQLALANALLSAGRVDDAEEQIRDLLQRDSTDGLANLVMARIQAKLERTERAASFYHRAIYGHWKDNASEHQRKARLELVELLSRENARKELLAELLPLQDETAGDPNVQKRIAGLYLLAGSPARAETLFREIAHDDPSDAAAIAGLGEAEFAQGDYRAARRDLLRAAGEKPGDSEIQRKLALVNQVLGLDPMARGLGMHERYTRSMELLTAAVDYTSRCFGSSEPVEFRNLAARAQTLIRRKLHAAQESEAVETNLSLAEQIWQARKKQCARPIGESEQAMDLVLAKAAK